MHRVVLAKCLGAATVVLLVAGHADGGTDFDTFIFQGVLKQDGIPANGVFDIEYRLFDAPTGGTQVGPTIQIDNFQIVGGLFEQPLDFGPNSLDGGQRFVQVGIREHDPGNPGAPFTPLTPRQQVAAAPYARMAKDLILPITFLAPPATPVAVTVQNNNTGGTAIAAESDSGTAVDATTNDGTAVAGVCFGPDGKPFLAAIVNFGNPAPAIAATTNGLGPAIDAEITNSPNAAPAVEGRTNGTGPAIRGQATGAGPAGDFGVQSPGSNAPSVKLDNDSLGALIEGTHTGGGDLVQLVNNGTGTIGLMACNADAPGLTVRNSGSGYALRSEGSVTVADANSGLAGLSLSLPGNLWARESIAVGDPNGPSVRVDGGSGNILLEGILKLGQFFPGDVLVPKVALEGSTGNILLEGILSLGVIVDPNDPNATPAPVATLDGTSGNISTQGGFTADSFSFFNGAAVADSLDVSGGSVGTALGVFAGNGSAPAVLVFGFSGGAPALSVIGDAEINGDLCTTSGAVLTCSDERLKHNIEPLRDALEIVLELRGVRFDWRRDAFPERHFSDERQIGFIAQQLEQTLPEVVSRTHDGYLAVDYGRLTPVLAEAIAELHGITRTQKQHIEAQQAEIRRQANLLAELEDRIERLERRLTDAAGGPDGR